MEPKKQSRGVLLAGIAVVTVALLIGMKFIMSDDTASVQQQPAAGQPLFKEQAPAGLSPVARSQSGSDSGLDMFSKTNAGYYGEEESTAAAAGQQAAEPEVKRSTATAAKKAAPAKTKAKTTVIPRMKATSFGGISPTNVAPGGAGQGMPDLSGMMQQIQQKTGGAASGDGSR